MIIASEQIIRGTDLSLTAGLSGLKGFGTSLASGVDVDANTYNGIYITLKNEISGLCACQNIIPRISYN
jgi:hypothetical protein